MSVDAGTAYVRFKPDFSQLNRDLARQIGPMADQFGGRFGKALGPVMAQQSKHLRTLTTGAKYAAAGGAALAVVVGKDLVQAGMKFEKQMSVNAAISEANTKQQAALERQSIKLGKATFYSASEAAEAQGELVKGGLNLKQVLGGGLPAALSLAEAGQLELAVAAETTVNAMKLFGLQGKEAGGVADMLSTAANRTTADVLDFAMALKQGGSVTKLAGYEMNETVTVLEALAEAGIKNSDAGTSMKTATIQLLKPSKKQLELTKELNLHWITQNGELKSAAGLSKELHRATDDMTKAERAKVLATLAGTDGVRTLNALYAETPAELKALEVANARQGTAQDIAAKKMDNFAGTWEQFKGTLETVEIQIYKGIEPALEDLTEEATQAANRVAAVFENPNLSDGEKVQRAISLLQDELARIWDRNEMSEHLLDALDYVLDTAIPHMAENAGELGLVAAEGFVHGFTHADLLGKAVMGAWLLNFIGGKAAFVGLGKTVGRQFGISFATSAAAEVAASRVLGVGGSAASGAAAGVAGRTVRVFGPDDLARVRKTGIGEFGERALLKELGLTAGSGAAGGAAAKWGSRLKAVGKGLGTKVLGVTAGYLLAEIGRKGIEAFGVGDPTEGQGIKTSLTHGFNTENVAEIEARNLGYEHERKNRFLGIHPKLSEEAGKALREQFKDIMVDLSVDASAGMGEINKDLQRGLQNASAHFSTGTKPWRSHTAEAMTGAVHAIETGMQLGTISTAQGQKEINKLLREIHLVKGDDPFGLAKATVQTFKDTNGITAAGTKAWLNKLDQMPKGAAKKSVEATQGMLRAWAEGNPKLEHQVEALTSYQIRKFGATNKQLREGVRQDATGPIADAFREAAMGVGGALENIGTNTSQMLKLLGLKDIGQFQALVFGPNRAPQTRGAQSKSEHNHPQFRQEGGPISGTFLVPGSGSGDTFRTALPPGSFIENREAVRALPAPFRDGGMVPVALEPGERGYLPSAVRKIGLDTLKARNAAVSRFQTGGEVRVSGPGVLGEIGHGALEKVTDGINEYFKQHQPKSGLGSMGVHGSVGDHPELQPGISAIVATILKRWPGLQITSTTGGGHAANSLHYQGRAVDLGASSAYMLQAAAWIKANLGAQLTEGIHNPNLSIKYGNEVPAGFWGSAVWGDHIDHIHAGKQLGGLIQRLASGGGVKGIWAGTSIDKTYANSDGISTGEVLPGYVIKALAEWSGLPGVTMFQVTEGESTGHAGMDIPDPPGRSRGLYAINDHWNPQFGATAMRNPILNTLAAKELADAAGGPNSDIWHGSSHVTGWDLHWDGDPVKIAKHLGGAASDGTSGGGTPTEVPYHEKGGVTGAGGGTTAPAKGKVKTEKLDFGSLPDTIPEVQRELSKRRAELGRYRAALRSNKDPEVKSAIEANINLLRNRVHALLEKRKRLLHQKAQEAVAKKIAKRGTLPGFEEAIASAERAYESASEEAQQIVSLEPEEGPGVKTYIEGREAPAWANVLGTEAHWRNALLAGEGAAAIRLRDLEAQQERLNALKATNPKAFDKQKHRLPAIRSAIAAIKEQYTPGQAKSLGDLEAGRFSVIASGAFEESLVSLQGLGKSMTPLDSLPSEPVAGSFGGLIFDTQMSIRELGLKIKQAGELGDVDNSELLAIMREIAERERKGRYVAERLSATSTAFDTAYPNGAMPPYAGKAHTGAIVPGPPTEERTMILRGQERVRTPEQELAMAQAIRETGGHGVVPTVETIINGDIISDHPDPVETVLRDPRTGRAIKRTRGGRVTAGGARR